ncbi:hypothetical protein SNEBB_001782 [Seison nebaliae]|nr:hypothetical protein SNEBB_001782 [Seison nebaliae]
MDLNELFKFAMTIIENCHMEFKKGFQEIKNKKVHVETKECFADLVTIYDRKIEDLLRNQILERYPEHRVIAEEDQSARKSDDAPKSESSSELWNGDRFLWIIDPIDGTSNYVHGNENCCISLAVAKNQEILIGIISCPLRNEIYYAQKGHGTFLNKNKLENESGETKKNLIDSLIIAELGSGRDEEKIRKKLENIRNILLNSHGIRAYGSCAINMCLVASGQVDGMVEFGIHIWDIAAGLLICEEAGCPVTDTDCNSPQLLKRRILVSKSFSLNKEISSKLIHQIQFESD